MNCNRKPTIIGSDLLTSQFSPRTMYDKCSAGAQLVAGESLAIYTTHAYGGAYLLCISLYCNARPVHCLMLHHVCEAQHLSPRAYVMECGDVECADSGQTSSIKLNFSRSCSFSSVVAFNGNEDGHRYSCENIATQAYRHINVRTNSHNRTIRTGSIQNGGQNNNKQTGSRRITIRMPF